MRPSKPSWKSILALIACWWMVAVAACSPQLDQVLPTAPPTLPPTATPIPPTVTHTALPPTATPLATRGGPTVTPLIRNTLASILPTATGGEGTVLSGEAVIEYFLSDEPAIAPGDTITLFWRVQGVEQATIYRVSSTGKRLRTWNVRANGTLQIGTQATEKGTISFMLVAGPESEGIQQTISVSLSCEGTWFFSGAPPGCPNAPAVLSNAALQTFERGMMVWVEQQQRIYVLFGDGQSPSWAYYFDEWIDGQPDSDPSLVPPTGLSQPIRGFGLVWRNQAQVRDRLGWATSGETGYQAELQGDPTSSGSILYMRLPDGRIAEIADAGKRWRIMTG